MAVAGAGNAVGVHIHLEPVDFVEETIGVRNRLSSQLGLGKLRFSTTTFAAGIQRSRLLADLDFSLEVCSELVERINQFFIELTCKVQAASRSKKQVRGGVLLKRSKSSNEGFGGGHEGGGKSPERKSCDKDGQAKIFGFVEWSRKLRSRKVFLF